MKLPALSDADDRLADSLLVVAADTVDAALVEALRRRSPDKTVRSCPSFLSAIADLSDRAADTIVAGVSASQGRLDDAVAALRQAAGDETRIVLCCLAQDEPLARRTLAAGADDYVI